MSRILSIGHAGIHTPPGRHYPQADTPARQMHPPGQTPPWPDTPLRWLLQRTVRILLECILVICKFVCHYELYSLLAMSLWNSNLDVGISLLHSSASSDWGGGYEIYNVAIFFVTYFDRVGREAMPPRPPPPPTRYFCIR